MVEHDFHLHSGKTGAAITVTVVPKSNRNAISEILDDGTLIIHLKAPSNGGKANQALIDFLAEILNVKPAQIEIIAGIEGKDKLVTITDLDTGAVQKRILKHAP